MANMHTHTYNTHTHAQELDTPLRAPPLLPMKTGCVVTAPPTAPSAAAALASVIARPLARSYGTGHCTSASKQRGCSRQRQAGAGMQGGGAQLKSCCASSGGLLEGGYCGSSRRAYLRPVSSPPPSPSSSLTRRRFVPDMVANTQLPRHARWPAWLGLTHAERDICSWKK